MQKLLIFAGGQESPEHAENTQQTCKLMQVMDAAKFAVSHQIRMNGDSPKMIARTNERECMPFHCLRVQESFFNDLEGDADAVHFVGSVTTNPNDWEDAADI